MASDSSLDALVERWREHLRRGEPVSLSELCADCPEQLPALRERIGPRADSSALVAGPSLLQDHRDEHNAPTFHKDELIDDDEPRERRLPTLPGYEILGQLGLGGFGVVYKARDTRLNRLVAVKMILAGAHANAQQLARFHVEAEALASIHHPNIIQVHDSGEYEDCPYIVLEFVEGGTLEQRLSGREQPPAESAALIETLARAIHVAHLRGIVHRDLKPANILLTSDRTPKISDFGLAKKLQGDSNTFSGSVLGTPNYMAPEQALGHIRKIGPHTDVYSLGAILYELLTGQPPFDGATFMETLRLVQHEEVVPIQRRCSKPISLDLATICMKCLEREHAHRYPSALDLAEDLHRYRAGEPIRARPVSFIERTAKWVRRRPAVTALIAVIVVAAVSLLLVGLWSYRAVQEARDRAEQRSHQTRRALDDLYDVASRSHDDRLKEEFLRTSLAIFEKMVEDEPANDELREETALALFRIARISRELGENERSEKNFARAIAFQEQLHESDPGYADYRRQLADSRNWQGELFWTIYRLDDSRSSHTAALELRLGLARDYPDDWQYQHDVAESEYNLALLHDLGHEDREAAGRFQRAEEMLQKIVDATEPLAAAERSGPSGRWYALNLRARQSLARVFLNQGQMHRRLRDFDRARQSYERGLQQLNFTLERDADNPEHLFDRALTCNNLGNALSSDGKKMAEAEQAYGRAIDDLRRLERVYPRRPAYREELANAFNGLGALQILFPGLPRNPQELTEAAANRLRKAETAFGEAITLFEKLEREQKNKLDSQLGLGTAKGNLGYLYMQYRNAPDKALPYLQDAVSYLRAASQRAPERAKDELVARLKHLATVAVDLKNHAQASEAVDEVVKLDAVDRNRYAAARILARCIGLSEQQAAAYREKALGHLRAINPATFRPATLPTADEAFHLLHSDPLFIEIVKKWK